MTVTREEIRPGSLLSTTNRVEAPFVRVEISGFSFGTYEDRGSRNENYPNYINSLEVTKINGTVNQYKLSIRYPITHENDPNFFDKLLSSATYTRKIKFMYGDSMLPAYIYRDEEAIITNVESSIDVANAVISYTISAVSASTLTLNGTFKFVTKYAKPSDEIKRVLRDPKYHLTEVFTGMQDASLVDQFNLIAGDDRPVQIPTYVNVSALEYISSLVSLMEPIGTINACKLNSDVYSLTTYEDTSGVYGGPYFKVQRVVSGTSYLKNLCTYEVDIGYPSANIVTSLQIADNANWMMCLDYNADISSSDYVKKIDSQGVERDRFSPLLNGINFYVKQSDISWWKKATQYPITLTMEIKGLLKPVVLMQYVRLNVWFYGHKHSSSGYYIITSQVDKIDASNGYRSTLKMIRVGNDEDYA